MSKATDSKPQSLAIAVLTVSDTRTVEDDTSGQYLAEALEYIDAWRQATGDQPAGICGPIGPTEQLPLVARLVNEFATRYTDRIVVFDAPPLLSTPESQVLAGLVGQIVYVIEAGKTPYAIVRDALEMLPRDKAIGLVLNKSESISNRGGYYYNYYAAYGNKETSSEDNQ